MRISSVLSLSLASVLVLAGSGCGKKKEPPPPPVNREPPPPPPPDPVLISSIIGQVRPDARVNFAQEHAPVDRDLAIGMLKLCDALAKKDADALRPLLDPAGKAALSQIEQDWGDLEIEAVRVVYTDSGAKSSADVEAAPFVTAVKSTDAIVLVWTARRFGDGWVFAPGVSTPESKPLATDWDGKTMVDYMGGAFGFPPEIEALLSADTSNIPIPGGPAPNVPSPSGGGGSPPGGPSGG